MKIENYRKKSPNFIEDPEQKAKELFGYDEETLLKEFKEAELELEQQKRENPQLEQELEEEADRSFALLMEKIHAADLKPVTEREYFKKKAESEREILRLKPTFKVLLVAAAVFVVLNGMGIGVSARRESEYEKVKVGERKNQTVWSDNASKLENKQLQDAYEITFDTLGIDVVELGYIPSNLIFDRVNIEKGHSALKFKSDDKQFYLKQTKYPVDSVSDGVISDRSEKEVVYNIWLDETFIIEENVVDGIDFEYSTSFARNGAYYYVSGNIEKKEFIKIVEGLSY